MKYTANPVVVEAFAIKEVGELDDKGCRRLLLYGSEEEVSATPEMMSRMTPVENDYWVIQSDGYVCKCDCGSHKIIYASNLGSGATQSCGCKRYEKRSSE